MTANGNRTVGLFMLSIVIISWVSSSFLLNQIFEDDSYRKPFFITYINVSSFVLYLIPIFKDTLKQYYKTGKFSIEETLSLKQNEEEKATNDDDEMTPLLSCESDDAENDKLTVRNTIRLSAVFAVLWFGANLATNASLSYTSVASQTILSSTSSFFTLVLGAVLQVESVTENKIIGLLISFFGIILVTKSDSLSGSAAASITNGKGDGVANISVMIGNILALAGALVYGLYSTFLKKSIKNESRINIKLFFGFVGFFTIVLLWPSIIILDYYRIETFELPMDSRILGIIVINGAITFISDYCWAKSILLTSPLTVTVGLSTTIPFAMVGDFIFKGKSISLWYLMGALMVLSSFILINKEESSNNNNRQLGNDTTTNYDIEKYTTA